MQTPLTHVMNPTDLQRHEMLMNSLNNAGRPEDYDYIIQSLSPPSDITNYALPGELKGIKIGIIGGGLAGMAAAYELRKLGADITVLEASKGRVGGRVYTFYFDPEGKYYGEFGAVRIPVSHETVWHYINLFGLNTLSMTPPRRNNFLYVHNTRLRTAESVEEYLYPKYDLTPRERSTPWSKLSSYAINGLIVSLPPQVRAELIRILPEYSPEILPLMNISLRENYEALGLSQGAIQLISGVIPISGATLQAGYDEAAQNEYSLDFLNTYRIQGGSVNLPYAFYRSFSSDNPPGYRDIPNAALGLVSFNQGHFVTGIYQSDYRSKVVLKYRNTTEAKENADIFDYCICSIPYSSLRKVEIKPYFSNMKMQAIMELNYIDAQKTLFLCNRRFWEKNTDYGNMTGGISFTDLPIQSIIYPGDHNACPISVSCSPNEPGVLTASYNLGQNAVRIGGQKEPMRYEIVRRNVEEVHGLPRGFLNSVIERHQTVHWNDEPDFTGAFALSLPGQKPLFAYESLKPEFNNRIFFAGEHVSAKHGWIQGALYSGKAAANQLAMHFHGNPQQWLEFFV